MRHAVETVYHIMWNGQLVYTYQSKAAKKWKSEDYYAEEEELQRQRLLARRGLSAQDMELLRKTQEPADQMEEQ